MTRSRRKPESAPPNEPDTTSPSVSQDPEPVPHQDSPTSPITTTTAADSVSPQHSRAYSHLLESRKPDSRAYTPPLSNLPGEPDPDSDSDSSSSSSCSSPVTMSSSSKANEAWTNNGPGKAPTVNSRFLKPQEYGHMKASFIRYLCKAKISDTTGDTARDQFMSCFQHEQTMNFFMATHDDLLKLSSVEFKKSMLDHLVGPDWLKTICALILNVHQDSFENGAFNVMYETIISYNSLLKSVGLEIDNALFQSTLCAGLNRDFEHFLESEGVDLTLKDFASWVSLLKEKDVHFRRFRRPELECLSRLEDLEKKRYNDSSHRLNNTQSAPLSNVSNFSSSSHSVPQSNSSSDNNNNAFRFPHMSDLDPSQRTLYNRLEMCLCCRNLFAGHRVNACNVPTPLLQVPFCPLDEADAVYAEKAYAKCKQPITYNAVIKRVCSTPAIAAVAPAPVPVLTAINDLDEFMSKPLTSSSNIAAVWGDIPVTSMQSDIDLYLSRSHLRSPAPIYGCCHHSNSSEVDDYHQDPSPSCRSSQRHHTSNSSSYNAPAVAAVIENLDDAHSSDDDVGYRDENGPFTPPRDPAAVDSRHTVSDCSPFSSPFSSPHFLFPALVEGPNVEFPLPMDLLLDNGSHLILIRDDLVSRLGLKRHLLRKPESISVMNRIRSKSLPGLSG
ncbi:hypothetical protein K435DRAFT_850884 [Dendrothele bispora CBS 962.96]|uniref:Uncharacterized protein n=1 Tax=Dendrothele bispora (strain CBS 962.96) TaxID=1314807 RepID=A0A4S8MN86_DENBC|nr:hypothetical protein K435DRAFT_850884 [Dendrothele bispora CBS 962.96]